MAENTAGNAGADLGDAFDALNEELAEVERWMVSQGLRMRAEVPLPEGGYLVWCKTQNVYRLVSRNEDGAVQPLTSTSAQRRLDACAAVPLLLEEAHRRQDSVKADVAEAARKLRALRGARSC